MLNQPTMEKLQTMKLHGMADAFRAQLQTTDTSQLSFEERFAMLVDQQWLWKENRALARRLRAAKLKERGVVEDIDYQHSRGLDRKLIRTLASSEWVRQHQNVLLIGPTGIGKTWLGCALAQKACRDGFTILHKRAAEMFRDLAVAHVDGSFGRQLTKLSRIDILVLDDFAMAPLKDGERRDFLELCDDRYQRRSMILTSQLPLAHWHNRSATLRSPTAFSTGWFITPTASNSMANLCARNAGANPRRNREKQFSTGLRGGQGTPNAVLAPHPIPAQNTKTVDSCE